MRALLGKLGRYRLPPRAAARGRRVKVGGDELLPLGAVALLGEELAERVRRVDLGGEDEVERERRLRHRRRREDERADLCEAALAELAATIDADKSEGAAAVDALIARVPVRGGSGVRLRKALLEKDGGRGRGGGAAGRGGRAGRGRGKGKKAPPPAPKAAKPTKPKKKKDDGAMLAATLAEGTSSGRKKRSCLL